MNRSIILALAATFTAAACDDELVRPDAARPAGSPLVAAVSTAADGPPRYSIRVLDVDAVLDPDLRVIVAGYLNDRGQVTARLVRTMETRLPVDAGVLVWDTETGAVERIAIDDVIGAPFIDDAGRLGGTMDRDPGPFIRFEPFLWTPGAGLQPLGFSGVGRRLNDRGQIVGSHITGAQPDLDFQAFLWDPVSGLKLLGEPSGATESHAWGPNDAGVAVGLAFFVGQVAGQPMLWDPVSGASVLPRPVGQLGGAAIAINNLGQIAGEGPAFWASRDAEPIPLPCDTPFEDCVPIDINDQGVILGDYGNDEAEIPMIWFDGRAYDLNQRIVAGDAAISTISFVLDINDRGQIGGYALVRFDPVLGSIYAPAILTPIATTRAVRIDVKPGSDPSSYNLDGEGKIPAAIFGEADLDPDDIDPETLELNGLIVARRGNGRPQCGTEDVDGDGFADLVCQFVDDPSRWTGSDDVATITGELRDGTAIEGTDPTIRRRP